MTIGKELLKALTVLADHEARLRILEKLVAFLAVLVSGILLALFSKWID